MDKSSEPPPNPLRSLAGEFTETLEAAVARTYDQDPEKQTMVAMPVNVWIRLVTRMTRLTRALREAAAKLDIDRRMAEGLLRGKLLEKRDPCVHARTVSNRHYGEYLLHCRTCVFLKNDGKPDYQVRDTLRLREGTAEGLFTGREFFLVITHVQPIWHDGAEWALLSVRHAEP